MITAKDELAHVVDTLSEEESEAVLAHLHETMPVLFAGDESVESAPLDELPSWAPFGPEESEPLSVEPSAPSTETGFAVSDNGGPIVVNVSVHHLEHPTKPRRYVFRVLHDCDIVNVDRWDAHRRDGRTRRLSVEEARKLWKYLMTTHGYRVW